MKTTLTYTSLNTLVPWPALLAQQLDHWHSLTTITAAEIVLEHERDSSRAFRVKVRLEVPRADLRADASDATLEGALRKANTDLELQIQVGNAKPPGQGKSTRQPNAIPKPKPAIGRRA